jgi:hypothetical protein
MELKKAQGLNEITRYNLFPSAAVQLVPAEGYSTGQAIEAVQQVAKATLPRGYSLGWEGLSWDESQKGNAALYIFLIVVVFVYLVLVAQYESFLLPFAVVLSLPAGVFGSFAMLRALGLANDIYAQVGLVMLVGLLGKNAVLIVELAVQRHRAGATVFDAAIEGAKARFRPILMTSFAFIAGLIPLVFASGPGAVGNVPPATIFASTARAERPNGSSESLDRTVPAAARARASVRESQAPPSSCPSTAAISLGKPPVASTSVPRADSGISVRSHERTSTGRKGSSSMVRPAKRRS